MARQERAHSMPPRHLTGRRVRLRALGMDALLLERELSRDPDVVRWTYYPPRMDGPEARSWIELGERRRAAGAMQRYCIVDEEGSLIGTCGIGDLDTESPEIFYAVLRRARRRGVATETAELLTGWVLGHGYSSVVLDTFEGNVAGERVARKAGFSPGGRFEERQRGEQVRATRWTRVRG